MGVGHAASGTVTGGGWSTTLLACVGGDRRGPDVGLHFARRPLDPGRSGFRYRQGEMGFFTRTVSRAEAMDEAGDVAVDCNGGHGVVRGIGASVRQWHLLGAQVYPSRDRSCFVR